MDYGESGICYRKITIEGVVQGVGFRPFVYRVARKYGLSGYAANVGGYVELYVCGTADGVDRFIGGIRAQAPPMSVIRKITANHVPAFEADGFIIKPGERAEVFDSFIPPDVSICADCVSELQNAGDRRFNHVFNTCVNCGPRFSVIKSLPYDRANTSMSKFPLCEACADEYGSSEARRFHAETISCNSCGPKLTYITRNSSAGGAEAFENAALALEGGQIIAIKGVGGYHLACSAFDENAVAALRRLKGRDSKPFAVMFKDSETVMRYCLLSEKERELLESPSAPIVLLEVRQGAFAESVLRHDSRCGCFLPYTGLHKLLLERLEALVMTSANINSSPVIFEDGAIFKFSEGAECEAFEGVLVNDREIIRSVEDSVMQVSRGQAQILRRGRGTAPAAFRIKTIHGKDFIALGGDLKASFCVVKNGYAHVGQYFGDLEDTETFERYKAGIADYIELLGADPRFVVCDMHHGYFSTDFAEELGLPVFKVQHHFAHAASVLAERESYSDVIAVCFDGTGLGTDESIWGGEFLVCRGSEFERVGHLKYTELIGANSSAVDAGKTALCYLMDAGVIDPQSFNDRYEILKAAIRAGIGTAKSSSAGRLFDAVAALLGVCTENKYEGMCAIKLQQAAERGLKSGIEPVRMAFEIIQRDVILLDYTSIIAAAFESSEPEAFALGFHIALGRAAGGVCELIAEKNGIREIVLSGGVFQNKLLTELTENCLREKGFEVYTNSLSPPNDGGISLGQAYLGGLLCV